MLRGTGALVLGSALTKGVQAEEPALKLRKVSPQERKLLFVVCAYGGASIIDAFMPVLDYEVGDLFLAQTLNVFPDTLIEQRPGSVLRTPKVLDSYGIYARPTFGLGDLVARHGADLAVIGHEVSSVNHTVGQQRALNGASVNRGRTLMEAMALRYAAASRFRAATWRPTATCATAPILRCRSRRATS